MPSSVLLHAYLKNNVENEMLSRSGWQKTAGKQVFITVILPPDYRHSSWQDLLYQINVFKHCTGSWKEKWQSTMKNSRLRFKPKMNWKDKKFKLSTDICTTRLINIRKFWEFKTNCWTFFFGFLIFYKLYWTFIFKQLRTRNCTGINFLSSLEYFLCWVC